MLTDKMISIYRYLYKCVCVDSRFPQLHSIPKLTDSAVIKQSELLHLSFFIFQKKVQTRKMNCNISSELA